MILQWNTNDFAVSGLAEEHARLIGARYRNLYDESERYQLERPRPHHLVSPLDARDFARTDPPQRAGARGGRHFFGMLRSFRDEVVRDGGDFLLLIFPELVRFDDHPYESIVEALRDFARENGIAYVDLLPELSSHPARELWVHETDHHPNYRAHEIAHRAVLQKLGAPW